MKHYLLIFSLFLPLLVIGQQDSLTNLPTNPSDTAKVQLNELGLQLNNESIYLNVGNKQNGVLDISLNGEEKTIQIVNGQGLLPASQNGLLFIKSGKQQVLYHQSDTSTGTQVLKRIPLWLSLIPPLVAIVLALLFKEVILSLFIGIFSGVFIIGGMHWGSLTFYLKSLLKSVDTYVVKALSDSGHLSIILFSLLIGGMVAIISKNGGMYGIVQKMSKYAKDPVSTQCITWILGLLIFFDDYANTLIVGNTMRSATDKFSISREKLAYIVDSTAAPVAAVAFITTWIGAELGYIGDASATVEILKGQTPYSLFLSSLKYSFYPFLTLAFILFIIFQKKDFGPMIKAEKRARLTGQVSPARTQEEDEPDMEDLSPVKGSKHIWWHAAVPILVVINATILGLFSTGFSSLAEGLGMDFYTWGSVWSAMDDGFFTKLGNVIGSGDSYAALIWASFSGVVIALVITLASGTMKLMDSMHWMVTGFKTMLPAIIILVLAWALAATTQHLHTADYLSNALGEHLNPYLLPAIIFILAAFISFSTGSSWSTMAILYPIAIPTAYAVCMASGLETELSMEIILCVISTVLGASVLGDHCSPISDTTILSSLATDCNHLDHVRTQLPYALTVGVVSLIGISLAILLGGGWFISLLLLAVCGVLLFFIVKWFGQDVPDVSKAPDLTT